MFLDLNSDVRYIFGGFKRFVKGEYHVTRVSREDILILMLDGTLNFTENGEEISLGKGEYYVQKLGGYQSSLRPSSGAYYIYIHFLGSWCRDGIYGLPKKGFFDIEKIYLYAERLCRASSTRNEAAVSVKGCFCNLLELLLNDNRRVNDGLLVAEKIHRYISDNFTSCPEIGDIAKRFNYSPDYVIRVFKRAYGITPHKYVTARRIEYAKLLLSTTDRPVGEISDACGYADFTAFYRAFRALTGASPNEWRNNGHE